jgi:REP element-mobilizing transposase RayT
MIDSAAFYRRRLPHWRQDEATYFVTWRLAGGQKELSAPERALVAAELCHQQGQCYEIYAYVIMNDHVHVLVRPLGEQRLEKIVHGWKSFTANRLQRQEGRRGQIWQPEYFDRIVRGEEEFTEKLEYIVSNPWKRWPELVEYSWVWPRGDQ